MSKGIDVDDNKDTIVLWHLYIASISHDVSFPVMAKD